MKRAPMRKIREALRLHAGGISSREMASSLCVGRTTLRGYLRRAKVAGLTWPQAGELSDSDLESRLYPRSIGGVQGVYVQPDWAYLHRELHRKGVTLALLWEEYRGTYPDGYGYSRFCECVPVSSPP